MNRDYRRPLYDTSRHAESHTPGLSSAVAPAFPERMMSSVLASVKSDASAVNVSLTSGCNDRPEKDTFSSATFKVYIKNLCCGSVINQSSSITAPLNWLHLYIGLIIRTVKRKGRDLIELHKACLKYSVIVFIPSSYFGEV